MENPNWRGRLRWFGAEFLVVVTGVLVALAFNAWYQGRQDQDRAGSYLKRIDGDLDLMIHDVNTASAFERQEVADGFFAYGVLSHPADAAAEQKASRALAHLLVRRTIPTHDGTYRDLISTGDMRLINDELRNEMVAYFDEADRLLSVIAKNNQVFVDDMYGGVMLERGLVMPLKNAEIISVLVQLEDSLSDHLRGGYADQPDRIWSLPANSADLAAARSVLIQRIRTSLLAERYMAQMLASARHLKHEIKQALR